MTQVTKHNTGLSPGLAILKRDGTLIDRKNADDVINQYELDDLLPKQYAQNPCGFFHSIKKRQVENWERTLSGGKTISVKALYLDTDSIMLIVELNTDNMAGFMETAFYQAIEQSAHGVVITDPDGSILYTNPQVEQNSGYTRSEMIGQTPALFQSGHHDDLFYEKFWETIQSGQAWSGEMINKHKDGRRYVISQTVSPIMDADDNIIGYVGINNDITEKWKQRNKLKQEARKDPTLDVATHDFMIECIEKRQQNDGEQLGVLALISVDNYSALEESIGPRTVNLVVETILEQARDYAHGADLISKLNDGEILLFSTNVKPNEVREFTQSLSNTLRTTFDYNNEVYDLDLSIGTTAQILNKTTPETLIDEADRARLGAQGELPTNKFVGFEHIHLPELSTTD